MMRSCDQYGELFHSDGAWQRLCWPCWRERKEREERADNANDLGYQQGYSRGYADGKRDYTLVNNCHQPALDGHLLRRIVLLTHPDRHPQERFVEANEVTRELLALREVMAA
jgi:hypothetical protein